MRVPARTTHELDFVEEYVAVAERFAVAVASTDLSAPVPACPGWSTYDLVLHLGNVHAWAATIVETRASAPEQNDAPRSRRPRVVSEWYAGKAEDLYEVLRSADPSAPCWNFTGINLSTGFWPRRQTHETFMHLVDLDQASGRTTDLVPALCADAITEVLEIFLPRMHARGYPAVLSAPLVLQAVDCDASWTIRPAANGPPLFVQGPAAEGLDRIEGTAVALWQLLWKRAIAPGSPTVAPQRGASPQLPQAEVTYVGDTDRIAAFVGSRLTP